MFLAGICVTVERAICDCQRHGICNVFVL